MIAAIPLANLTHLALLSNGTARGVDPYRLATWSALLNLCHDNGPEEVLRLLREHEASVGAGISKADPDDATVADCTSLQQPDLPRALLRGMHQTSAQGSSTGMVS